MSTLGFELAGAATAKASEQAALATEQAAPSAAAGEAAAAASLHPRVGCVGPMCGFFKNYTNTTEHVFGRQHEALHFMDLGWEGLRWA